MDVEASSPSENDDMDLRSAATSPASDLANDADDEPDQVEDHETPGDRRRPDWRGFSRLPDLDRGEHSQFGAVSWDRPVPPHLKEISSLASWTVSTHKPGCGVQALRNPSPASFWQSDGPQPHTLNIHFFKLVAIAHMRVYIDYEVDESYTPTKMEFYAGTGHHDLQHVCDMLPESPRGWLNVDLTNTGGPPALRDEEVIDDDDELGQQRRDGQPTLSRRTAFWNWRRIGTGPTLRCFLVQVRIIENHQNGKDTHLRGLQIFARDETYIFGRRRTIAQPRVHGTALPGNATSEIQRQDVVGSTAIGTPDGTSAEWAESKKATAKWRTRRSSGGTMREPDWMGELEMRIGESELR